DCVECVRVLLKEIQTDSSDGTVRQSSAKSLPVRAAISRLINPACSTAIFQPPGMAYTFIGGCIQSVRMAAIDYQIDHAGSIINVEDLLPGGPSICALEHSPFFISRPEVAHRRNVNDVRVGRMNHDARDVLRIRESHVPPTRTTIDRLVNTVSRIS